MVHISDHFTYKKLFKAVISPILMMVFTSVYSIVDGLFVSNFVGDTAFAGLNLIFPFTMIVGAIGFMFGTGGSALVSMKLGEGKKEEANRIFSGIVFITAIIGVVISIHCFIFMKDIAKLLGATEEMLPYATTYGKIIIIGETGFMLQNLFQTFCMVAEKPGFGFILSVVAGVINIILDAVLICGFKIGLAGAAIATIVAQLSGALIALIFFLRKKNNSLLRLTKPDLGAKNIFKAMANGSSEFLGNISSSVVGIVFNIQLLKYAGQDGVNAYGILLYLGFIFNAIFIGYSIGTAPIVGYHYGAENHDELKNVLKTSIVVNLITGVVMAGLAVLLAKPLSSIFVGYNQKLLDMTTNAMRIYAFSFIFSGLNIYISSFFTALNNGFVSAFVSVCRTLILQIACVFLLPLAFGLNGIWGSIILAEAIAIIIGIICLVLNKKKYQY